MAHTVKLTPPAYAPVPELEPGEGELLALPRSPYDAVLQDGFPMLRFPGELEVQYQRDEATQRNQLLRNGMALAMFLTVGLLLPDWLMVPDMFEEALGLRLLAYVLPLAIWLMCYERMSMRWREWGAVVGSSVSAGIVVWLCVHSQDEMAQPYFVSLAMIVLFNSGVTRIRFWPAMVADAVILLLFAIGVSQLHAINGVLLVAITLILLSTAVFGLYGSYWLEHEERTNWLLRQHEQLLLGELEQGNQRLDELSRHDALTGLANRRHVDAFLQQVWERARHDGAEVAVLMVDIDHFKPFNDHHGHPEGDACLHDVAQSMAAYLRLPGDLLGRFGGEEFLAVLSRATPETVAAAAERVRSGVRQMARRHGASPTADIVTVSIGAACVRPQPQERGPERLLALADQALYKAKLGGRDRVVALTDQG